MSNRYLRENKAAMKLADSVRGTYYGMKADFETIDAMTKEELRQRCKDLLKANKSLLKENGELSLGKRPRSPKPSND